MILACFALAACGDKEKEYDATGTFEATEVTVSAEQNGTLLSFDINEGDIVEQGTHEELLAKKGVYEKLYHSGTSLANQQSVC